MAWAEGVHTEQFSTANGLTVYVSDINNGDYILVREVDFGNTEGTEGKEGTERAPMTFTASAASALQGGRLEVRLDSPNAKPIGTLVIPATGGWEKWQTASTSVSAVTGKHDVYFTFAGNKGAKLFNLDWWQFNK